METLFFIAIAVAVIFLLGFFAETQHVPTPSALMNSPRRIRTAWAICTFLVVCLSAPYLIEVTPDNYRFVIYITLASLLLAGVYPIAEKK